MAVRYSDFPQAVDPSETHINYSFDHLIACVKYGLDRGELWYPHTIAIDSNSNQIYVVEGIYFKEVNSLNIARVSIFSETGEFINMFSHPDMKEPWGIAIHEDNVYVTDTEDHCILHFKVEADFPLVARLGYKGSGIGQFNEPRQLAVSTNGYVFATDCKNNRVQIFDSELHYQRNISHHSMELPIDVKLTPDEMIVLCQISPCVKVFSHTGDLIRSLITRGLSIGMQVIDSSFFCVDADSNILLCDCFDNQIKIFSKEGTLLHTVGEEGHQAGTFDRPQGLALTNDLKLVVVSRNSYCSLQIYSSY